MSWTYGGDPLGSVSDAVRLLCGDKIPTDPQLQDSEIAYFISLYTNPFKAAAYCADAIASLYARLIDKSVGDLRLSYSQRKIAYEARRDSLLKQATARTVMPFAGGISKADAETDWLNPDLKKPKFTKNQFSYPGADASPNGAENINNTEIDTGN